MIANKRRRKTNHNYGVLENRQVLTTIAPGFIWGHGGQFNIPIGESQEVITDLDRAPQILAQPENGTLTFDETSKSLVYQPDAGFTGKDSFEVVGQVHESSVTVWHSAYATPDWEMVLAGESATVDVLGNDYAYLKPSSDAYRYHDWGGSWSQFQWQQDSTGFSIVDVTQPDAGTVSVAADGKSLIFEAGDRASGEQEVTYTIKDSRGFQTTGSLTLHVVDQLVDGRSYVSEAQWKQDRIETWMERHAGSLSDGGRIVLYDVFDGLTTRFSTAAGEIGTETFSFEVQDGDIVKSQGDLLYYVTHDNTGDGFRSYLSIVDVANTAEPMLLSTTGFEDRVEDIFLDEDRVAVVTTNNSGWYVRPSTSLSGLRAGFEVTVLDVSSPVVPSEVYTAAIDGSYTDARLIGDQLYLVSQFDSGFGISPWQLSDEVIDPVSPADFIDAIEDRGGSFDLPTVLIQDGEQQTSTTIEVDEIILREEGSKSTLVTTLDIQSDASQPVVDMDLVGSEYVRTVYVSAQSMYLFDGESVIKLSLGADDAVDFSADGELSGSLVNQFAAHEHDGVLRVASNEHDGSVDVRVFEQVDDQLTVVGTLDDIAPGERIFSTTFVEEQLFVVTFRQIDPLFVIDLSVDSDPVILGELKIPGVSNYLQLIDDDILLAVGRDANVDTGQQTDLQVSLFDVADPQNPQLLDRYTFDNGRNTSSPLIDWGFDRSNYQAVTFDQASGTLMLPVSQGRWSGITDSNVTVFGISREEGIQLQGEVDFESKALRTVVSGDRVVYLSEDQLKTASLDQPVDVLATLELPPEETQAREIGAAEKVCFDPDLVFEERPELIDELQGIIEEFDARAEFNEERLEGLDPGLGEVLPNLVSLVNEDLSDKERLANAFDSTDLFLATKINSRFQA